MSRPVAFFGGYIFQFITVEDVAGVRPWHLTPKVLTVVRSLTGTMKAHYVERWETKSTDTHLPVRKRRRVGLGRSAEAYIKSTNAAPRLAGAAPTGLDAAHGTCIPYRTMPCPSLIVWFIPPPPAVGSLVSVRCHKSYIINAPRAFTALWRVVSAMLDPR